MTDLPLVLLAAKHLPEATLDILRDSFDVEVTDAARIRARQGGRRAAGNGGAGPVALLCTVDVSVDAGLIAALPDSVRVIATYSVGLDHIDLDAAAARGIGIVATRGALAGAVAEIAIFLMLGAARRGRENLALITDGSWTGWTPDQLLGVTLAGRRLGIFGMGEIGLEAAKRARAFGMEVVYHNRSERPECRETEFRWIKDVPEFLSLSEVLLLACPSTPQTRGFLDATAIGHLPQGAIVVNVARGDVIDDSALVPALMSGRIRAAGLDVFANEPAIDPAYRELPNVFATPHMGSSAQETRRAMMATLVTGIKATCG